MNKDKQAEGCLIVTFIFSVIVAVAMLLLSGCRSLPETLPSLPVVQGFAILPNCVAWCHIIVTVERADSNIDSSGGGAVTGGAQSLSASSTQTISTTDTKTVEPKP